MLSKIWSLIFSNHGDSGASANQRSSWDTYTAQVGRIKEARESRNYALVLELSLEWMPMMDDFLRDCDASRYRIAPCVALFDEILQLAPITLDETGIAEVHRLAKKWNMAAYCEAAIQATAEMHHNRVLYRHIRSQPGLVQSDLTRAQPTVATPLYYGEKMGLIQRVRAGRSYALSIPDESPLLERLK